MNVLDCPTPAIFTNPPSRPKALLLENIHPKALQALEQGGFVVELVKGALDENELIERIQGVTVLGIRSKTEVTKRVLEAADQLLCIGAFCIGTNQIDLSAAEQRGIAVFHAPFSNTRSVVELALGEMIMLIRNIPDKSARLHQGIWDKSAINSFELRGKKLGIVGYGSIGTQLSVVAEALGMKVYFYDRVEKLALGNAHRCKTLDELLAISDIISLHIDGRAGNENLIGTREFGLMKTGVIFLNLSRGHIVDVSALAKAVRSGRLGGAAVDVFPEEPKTNQDEFISELRGLPNVILTPHVGGSTEEAQSNIGEFVPARLLQFIQQGNAYGAVNFPQLQVAPPAGAHRLLHIHNNVPGVLAHLNGILAHHQVNIVGQYLKTTDSIGYVITDIFQPCTAQIQDQLMSIDQTIRLRIIS